MIVAKEEKHIPEEKIREYMQIVFGSRTMRIEQVLEVERRTTLYLMCSESNEATA